MSPACRGSIGAIPPRLAVPSTWAELDRAPLTAQFPPFGGGEVTVRDGEVTVRSGVAPKCRPPRRKTLTTGCHGRGSLRFGHNGAWPRLELAREPLNMRGNPFF